MFHSIYWGTQVKISKNNVFLSLKFYFVVANSADPDEMPHYVAFHLGLHFAEVLVKGFPVFNGLRNILTP